MFHIAGPLNCKTTEAGMEYIGHADTTTLGSPCMKWDQDSLFVIFGRFFPDDNIDLANNYCRNMIGPDVPGPVCLNASDDQLAFCQVPFCGT